MTPNFSPVNTSSCPLSLGLCFRRVPPLAPQGFCKLLHSPVGLQFPVPHFFLEVSTLFKVPLSLFVPKAFSILAGFYILVRILGETPLVAQFHSFFMLKNASPGVFYFTFQGEAQFIPSNTSIKEWKCRYLFISSRTSWCFPTTWVPVAPDLPRYTTYKPPALFKLLLEHANVFQYDSRELVHPALLFHYGLNPKEDKALSKGRILGTNSSSKCFSAKSPFSTPASSKSTGDPKGKRQAELILTQTKRAKVSTGLLAPKTSMHTAEFWKGLLSHPEKVFLEAIPHDQVMNSLASHINNAALLARDLFSWFERGPAVEEAGGAGEGHVEKERKHDTSPTHLRLEISKLHE
ncbi:UNVERIFIED_CONTAM: hypothetical protein Scaly_2760400 [Sesamum calycinum]|uniref:Uncharacterized protein n=1 Tax=Sesamum calycinum TaxID=2727403 RepID=A0AAW2IZA1_9LAMI